MEASSRDTQRQYVARYRTKVRRIDYAPSQEARAVIERHLAQKPGNIQLVIDRLVIAGDRILSVGDRP